MYENEKLDPLCCCEYFDRDNERNHLLGCCCNCIDFDIACERYKGVVNVSGVLSNNKIK